MCDFRYGMRTEVVEKPRIGYKYAADTLTGITSMYARHREVGVWMKADSAPAKNNYSGWYIYPAKSRKFAEGSAWTVLRVEYKGKCVYGKFCCRAVVEGVRAEFVRFSE